MFLWPMFQPLHNNHSKKLNDFSRIWTEIIRVEGENADHKTEGFSFFELDTLNSGQS